jgi:hypothetical protein
MIYLDNRKVNAFAASVHATLRPIQERLQHFHGLKYTASIDLSSAFLRMPLEIECRKYIARLFDSEV